MKQPKPKSVQETKWVDLRLPVSLREYDILGKVRVTLHPSMCYGEGLTEADARKNLQDKLNKKYKQVGFLWGAS